MNKPYLAIDHLGVAVKDLQRAVDTYRDILGFPVTGGETLEDRGIDIAFVDAGNARIELIAPTREDSEVSGFLNKRGEGLHHICLRVANIDESVAALEARGAKLAPGGIKPGAHGHRVAFLHPKGSHGLLIELAETHDS